MARLQFRCGELQRVDLDVRIFQLALSQLRARDKQDHIRKGLRLAAAVRDYQEQVRRDGFDGLLASDSDKEVDDAARPHSLQRFVESVTSKLSRLTTDLRRVEASRSQVKQLQETIAAKSRQVETQQRYFNDEDEEWELLIETRDSLPELEEAIMPITADPRLHLGPLAHPEVTVYSLGQDLDGRFYIDRYRTYQARRVRGAEATHE